MTQDKIYRLLAMLVQARKTCIARNNTEWIDRHEERIQQIVSDFLPSGSGWDCGTKLDLDNSTGEKLVLFGSYHHMNDNGFYDGWTEHGITVRPSLVAGYTLSISGRNRNDIKDYLYQTFASQLDAIAYWDDEAKRYRHTAPIALDPFANVPAV